MLLVPVLLGNLRSLEVFGAVGAAGFLDRQESYRLRHLSRDSVAERSKAVA